jgi:hypothetical protein
MRRIYALLIVSLTGLASGILLRRFVAEAPSGDAATARELSSTVAFAETNDAGSVRVGIPTRLRSLLESGKLTETPPSAWAAELEHWLRTNPKAAMAFVFHELPAEVALKLIPELGEELARLPDQDVAAALSSVRTEREMRLAWQTVLGARLLDSPDAAVDLARLAPPLCEAGRNLVNRAAAGAAGEDQVLALVRAGAEKSWLFPSRATADFGPAWISKLKLASGQDFLKKLRAHYADQWTDSNTLQFASQLIGVAPDADELLRTVVAGTLQDKKVGDSRALVRNAALTSAEALMVILNSLPEGFRRRKLAQMAIQAASGAPPPQREAVAAVLPQAESTSAQRAPLRTEIELKAIMEPKSGAAYQIAAAAPEEDRQAMVAHAANWFVMTGGTKALIESLSGLGEPSASPAVYSEVARVLIAERPNGLNAQDVEALGSLGAERVAALYGAVKRQGGSKVLGRQYK